MTWDNITLGQFQDIYKLTKDETLDEVDRIAKAISILYGLSEAQVDDLTIPKFNEMGKSCGFIMTGDIPGKPVKSFRVGTKKYAINYKPSELKHRQYVEILHFVDKPVQNMHFIMASLVQRVRLGFKIKNKAAEHSVVSNDMLNAPFLAVYHSCIFFCKLYKNLIIHIQDYLIAEMMSKGMTKAAAKQILTISINGMDGFIQRSRLPDLKA